MGTVDKDIFDDELFEDLSESHNSDESYTPSCDSRGNLACFSQSIELVNNFIIESSSSMASEDTALNESKSSLGSTSLKASTWNCSSSKLKSRKLKKEQYVSRKLQIENLLRCDPKPMIQQSNYKKMILDLFVMIIIFVIIYFWILLLDS